VKDLYISYSSNLDMTSDTLHNLVADRLEHLADRVEVLISKGDLASATLLRNEGLALASAFDREDTFLVVGCLTES
jgi:hypothetical protein